MLERPWAKIRGGNLVRWPILEIFESMLIDYDPAANWGNWAYIAGVGNDPRPFRKFNIHTQAKRYDSQKLHRKRWIQNHAE